MDSSSYVVKHTPDITNKELQPSYISVLPFTLYVISIVLFLITTKYSYFIKKKLLLWCVKSCGSFVLFSTKYLCFFQYFVNYLARQPLWTFTRLTEYCHTKIDGCNPMVLSVTIMLYLLAQVALKLLYLQFLTQVPMYMDHHGHIIPEIATSRKLIPKAQKL